MTYTTFKVKGSNIMVFHRQESPRTNNISFTMVLFSSLGKELYDDFRFDFLSSRSCPMVDDSLKTNCLISMKLRIYANFESFREQWKAICYNWCIYVCMYVCMSIYTLIFRKKIARILIIVGSPFHF